jgi:beta-RFAP synthase
MGALQVLAQRMQRGIRSGIGLGAFESGGFVVDGGRGAQTVVPPVIARLPFPSDWRVLLVFDPALQGLNGRPERDAFHQIEPMASEHAAELCRIVMMQVLPAIAEADFDEFSDAITTIQNAVGDYFADYQGGRYTSARVGEALHWLQARGIRGVGQTSWGPTGFAFIAAADQARTLVEGLTNELGATLRFSICAARNHGAQIARGSRERLAVRA